MSDPLREGAGAMLDGLRRQGIARILLATGDRADVAERVTEGLGLDGLRAGLTPDQKVLLVLSERKHGPVMMVGDGVNDAPALAAADVGVAMGARGAAASAEAADVVLLVDRIDRLGPGIEIARGSRRIAVESVVAGIGLSVLGMIAAAYGYLTPVQGALLQEVIDVAVILNALRALRIAPHEPTISKPQAVVLRAGRHRARSHPMSRLSHSEIHMVHRIGWLRAAVLGANDGLVSTASLVVGVAAAGSGEPEVLIAGLAGLVAGAMSMAAGEYVSVSSQTDAEQADIARETRELKETPDAELDELTRIYMARGLDEVLARQVAIQLTAKDALGAHSRDELGISETVTAHPIQAALVSAATFAVGAVDPADHCGARACRSDHSHRRGRYSGRAVGVGRTRGLSRRCGHREGCRSRHFLGRACHGRDRSGGDDFRCRDVSAVRQPGPWIGWCWVASGGERNVVDQEALRTSRDPMARTQPCDHLGAKFDLFASGPAGRA